MRPMTIAQMIESDQQGGAEILMLDLSMELKRRGHRIVPVGPPRRTGWLNDRYRERGIEMLTLGNQKAIDFNCVRNLKAALHAERVDVVHSHEFSMCVYGTAATGLLGLPHVTTMHGNQEMTRALRRRMALRWAFKRSAAVVAVSEATRQTLIEELGVRPGAIEVVLNGVPVVQGQARQIRQEFGIAQGDLLIVASGTVVPRKGHMVLLKALHRLEKEGLSVPWQVIIAGRPVGDEADRLRQFITEAGFAGKVHLAGQRSDVADLLAAADIFTMPSLKEGLPLALLEAMLARKPIVASRTSGIPEAITDGLDGLLAPPGDEVALAAALSRVMREPALRESLAREALARATRDFTIESMANKYEQLYRRGMAALGR